MNSFDVFDTLIARRSVTTHWVWIKMSQEFNLPNFHELRPVPDDGSRSFREIYDQLVDRGSIPEHLKTKMMTREVELEIENSFAIQENMDRVSDGDMLISDMYLPGEVILQMVRAAGLNRQVTIYQSNADKGKGVVWNELKNNPPQLHLGDNHITDFERPKQYGIAAELFTKSLPTALEKSLDNLGLLTREIRLRNNVVDYREYFDIACQLNVPLIFVMLEQIHRRSEGRPIVFIGRDCQLMWRVYNAYYTTAYYLPFSRKVAYNQPELAAEYIKQHSPKDALLVDISSTGETWTFMSNYGTFDILSVIYSDSQERPYLPKTFSYITKNSVCGQTNLVLEIMNCGDHGYLNSLEKIGTGLIKAEFADTELPEEVIAATHYPVYDTVDLAKFYKAGVRQQLNSMSDQDLITWFNQISATICAQNHLLNNLSEFYEKEDRYHKNILEIRKNIK